ncbi:hypothetical protein ILYODFUR_002092 [Ilyodon furcidens]|uniref:Uncharacterized protein n=1 Tax=Ilyodon furcidens TaxID=33524 RepID=A0ABV0UQK3_9TELE
MFRTHYQLSASQNLAFICHLPVSSQGVIKTKMIYTQTSNKKHSNIRLRVVHPFSFIHQIEQNMEEKSCPRQQCKRIVLVKQNLQPQLSENLETTLQFFTICFHTDGRTVLKNK